MTDDPTASTPVKLRAPAKPRATTPAKAPAKAPAKPRARTVAKAPAKPGAKPRAERKGPAPTVVVARPTAASSSVETARAREVSLYLLRHADAGDSMAWTGDDAERPLSKKGRRQSKRVGRLLADLDVRPDVILTSPKVRSAETAKLVGRLVGRKPATDDRLALDFGGTALAGILAGLGEEVTSVMLVGHDPDFSTTLSWLVGGSLNLAKGALAVVVLPDGQPAAGRGVLRWLLPPDAIPG